MLLTFLMWTTYKHTHIHRSYNVHTSTMIIYVFKNIMNLYIQERLLHFTCSCMLF